MSGPFEEDERDYDSSDPMNCSYDSSYDDCVAGDNASDWDRAIEKA